MSVPPPRRDFAPNLKDVHRTRGAAATKKANTEHPEVDWDAACKRVRAMLRRQYARGAMEGPELPHLETERQEGGYQNDRLVRHVQVHSHQAEHQERG